MTPLEVFTGERPRLADLIPFGAKGFMHVPKELRTKWEPNSIPCIFTGYGGTNQYRVMVNRRIHITRDFDMARRPEIGGGQLLPERVIPITIDDDSSDENTTSAAHQQEPVTTLQIGSYSGLDSSPYRIPSGNHIEDRPVYLVYYR